MLTELADLLEQLSRRRQAFLAELEAMDERRLHFRPEPSSWSILQVGHHLALIDQRMLTMMSDPRLAQRPLRRRPKNVVGSITVRLVLASGIRVPMPDKVRHLVSPPPEGDVASLRAQWEEIAQRLRQRVEEYTEADARRYVALHPVAGPLTPAGTLRFQVRHFDHHLRQVRRLQRAADRAGR